HQTHDVIERVLVGGRVPYGDVQPCCHQRSFGVIADQCVRRVLVLLVVARPGVKRTVCDTLFQASGCFVHHADGFGQTTQVCSFVEHTTTQQEDIVVIRSEAFEYP